MDISLPSVATFRYVGMLNEEHVTNLGLGVMQTAELLWGFSNNLQFSIGFTVVNFRNRHIYVCAARNNFR